ncbi:hypothetical protein DICPUDRAFT_147339 [Dictyostelium purpureum]|uniref:U3 small nucleolar ribonucleoprotein protein MPP10 n=1 Tax=Dictyostelium purpureum TaxID=5786 RepID=F0Z893_DICPU|nr:uncharacterized protein DICPUDRAFT_147339 [Dictyostelium purpureum]EGC39891.1 hypothetical protein DICPUDRAFT_147339 [Dictyostelium purpureum]|eukprot:XP_003283642.1 hypothetical protein DICPUDRAFT_147339 [Dictyostelium purpureum]
MEIKKDKNVLNKVNGFMDKVYDTPEIFVGSTNKVKDSMTDIMSNLYQLAKKNETIVTETETDALESLVTKDFDSEQIWAQIQLYNDPVLSELESKINGFVKSKENIEILSQSNKKSNKRSIQYDEDLEDDYQDSELDTDEGLDGEEDLDGDEDLEDDEDLQDDENLDDDDDDLQDDEDLEDEDEDAQDLEEEDSLDEGIDSDSTKSSKSSKSSKSTKSITKNNNKKNNNKNIDFFDAKEMEKFLDDEDDNEYQRREDEDKDDEDDFEGDSEEEDGGLDLPDAELDDEERELDALLDKYMEQNEMEQGESSNKKSNKKNKAKDVADMKFDDFFADPDEQDEDNEDDFGLDHEDEEEEYQDDEDEEQDQLSAEEDGEEVDEKVESEPEEATLPEEELSAFQKKASRIQERIKKLEQENLKKKDWTMIGETSAKERPSDSLLGESLDYEHTQRAAPNVTEETNKSIEDIIKKRILEKNFDDVIRKTEKEFKDNYKKKVEISDEKSQEGLGDIYEKTYMKQVLGVEETDELKQKHIKIFELFNKLCYKLDSLTNFQYTPKMIKNKELNITTASAVTMEEKVPVATSTSTMIAPEEVYFKKNADEKGDSEKTKEDRVKERKQIKKTWKNEKEEKEAEERHKEKVDPNYAKRNTVAKDIAHLKQAKNVTIVDTSKSQVKSGDTRSGAFFKTIQTSEENRKKGIEDPNSLKSKKKQKFDALSFKTI